MISSNFFIAGECQIVFMRANKSKNLRCQVIFVRLESKQMRIC